MQIIAYLSSLGFNWLDLVIIIVFLFYILEGTEVGFVEGFFDLINFVLSFALGLRFYALIGKLLVYYFTIPSGFANALGFFVVAFLSEFILAILLRVPLYRGYHLLFSRNKTSGLSIVSAYFTSFNKLLGILPSFASAFILLSFLLTTIVSLPFSPYLKQTVSSSKFGNLLVANTQSIEKKLNDVFGGAVSETLNFLTVKPQSNEMVNLGFKTTNFTTDEQAEAQMLELVNKERTSRGLSALTMDSQLTALARSHSKDMFTRGYFSHYTPDGLSPFDRMAASSIRFTYAGENLALAPNTLLAMQGLMNSPGHKANILSPNFGKIGIGVMDGGIYGKMYTQEFTD